jgi:hypothetical protein
MKICHIKVLSIVTESDHARLGATISGGRSSIRGMCIYLERCTYCFRLLGVVLNATKSIHDGLQRLPMPALCQSDGIRSKRRGILM